MKEGLLFSPEDYDLYEIEWTFALGYARKSGRQCRCEPLAKKQVGFAHQVVCFRMFGRLPSRATNDVCDHINRNPMDNRRENLRIVTASENSCNSRWRGGLGVFKHAGRDTWIGRYRFKGVRYYVGTFPTRELALEAVAKSRESLPEQYRMKLAS